MYVSALLALAGSAVAAVAGQGPVVAPDDPAFLLQVHAKNHIEVHRRANERRKRCGSSVSRRAVDRSFEEMSERFQSMYNEGRPRALQGLAPEELSLDIEVEAECFPGRSARALVLRSGLSLEGTDIPSPSPWIEVELDGVMGRHPTVSNFFLQSAESIVELTTRVVRPNTVLNSSLLSDIGDYLDQLRQGRNIPDTNIVISSMRRASAQTIKNRPWSFYSLRALRSERAPLLRVHYTVGLPFHRVMALMDLSREKSVRETVRDSGILCAQYGDCDAEYRSFLIMATGVLKATDGPMCHVPGCQYMKRCQLPWLVRTHFGDMTRRLRSRLGDAVVRRMPRDVLRVWGGDPNKPLYPDGIMDYLKLPEMAEIAGFVSSRNGNCPRNATRQLMPSTRAGVLALAGAMAEDTPQEDVDAPLLNRTCNVYGKDPGNATKLTASMWLEGMLEGLDLMSDHDSPVSRASFSHLVWKSMGQWRLRDDDLGRVYVECRHPSGCVGAEAEDGVETGLRHLAARLVDLEARGQALADRRRAR